MLLEWTSTGGYELRAGAPGPHGMTALHLAATLKDGGKLAALLTGALAVHSATLPQLLQSLLGIDRISCCKSQQRAIYPYSCKLLCLSRSC